MDHTLTREQREHLDSLSDRYEDMPNPEDSYEDMLLEEGGFGAWLQEGDDE